MKAIFLLLLVALAGNALGSAAAGKLGDACASDQDCGPAMHCDACRGGGVCARTRPIDPKSKGEGLPFNRYSWLTTHNSFALQGASSATGSMLITATNQQDNVTSQLKNGVRGLMLDLYDFENDIWLCHSFGGQCYNFTAFQPAINVLKEIQAFLERNPSEVITIFIEDYVTSPQGLTKVFNASGLMKYLFPVSKMPKDGGDWPLLSDMIKQNQRLLVFTSKKTKEASDGIAYEWNYIVESQYGDDGMKAGLCPNRAESAPMNAMSKSLVLMNYFPTNPNTTAACADNSKSLISMLNTCHDYSAKRWPNFIAVDFYMKSNGGGAPKATDIVNGHLVCGCDNIAYCKVNATFGTCVVPPKAPKASPKASPSANPPAGDEKSSAVSIIRRSHLWMRLAEMLSIAMFISL